MPHFFGEAKKRVGCRAEHPARPSGRTGCVASPACASSREADFAVCNGCKAQGAHVAPAEREKHCMFTAVGTSRVSARQPTYFSCVAKRSRQEKATLRWRSALRADCTRRQHLKREASEARFAQTADASLSVSGTGDASPSNGISLQRQRQPQPQRQRQRSLRGATSNRNGRCAELQATSTVAARSHIGAAAETL